MMTKHEMTAVRTVLRVLAIRTDGWDDAQRADAGFDGGEWSGPAWGRAYETAEREAIEYVAQRFDVTEWALEQLMFKWEHYHELRWHDAMHRQSMMIDCPRCGAIGAYGVHEYEGTAHCRVCKHERYSHLPPLRFNVPRNISEHCFNLRLPPPNRL